MRSKCLGARDGFDGGGGAVKLPSARYSEFWGEGSCVRQNRLDFRGQTCSKPRAQRAAFAQGSQCDEAIHALAC
jgi:hypothetical protein